MVHAWCRPRFLYLILIIVAGSAAAQADAESGEAAFQAGIDASRSGRYEEALQQFLQAREQGRDTPALHHNLGVVYFKLGRYDEAEQAFREASRSRRMASVSYYNLGLIEERRDNRAAAEQWYRRARDAARTQTLRRMAERKLGLREAVDVPYSGYVELFAGHDSNPQLLEDTETELETGRERDSDSFLGALALGKYRFAGDWNDGAYVFGSVYTRRYLDVDEENTDYASAGLGLKNRTGKWQQDYQLGANRLQLDGDEVESGFFGSVRAGRALGNDLMLDLRLVGESQDGAKSNGYDYLTGERYRFRTRLQGDAAALNWKLSYEFTQNDRDVLVIENEDGTVDAFDSSPTRHDFHAGVEWPLIGLLRAEIGGTYRISRYDEEEVRNSVTVEKREDDRWSAEAGLSYPFAGGWRARLEAAYWDNDSNFARYDYDRWEVMLSAGKVF